MLIGPRILGACVVALVIAGGCDDDAEPDDVQDGMEGADIPAIVEGCLDGDGIVDIGDRRACTCDDGVESEQTCLSTGEFADCDCVGGGW